MRYYDKRPNTVDKMNHTPDKSRNIAVNADNFPTEVLQSDRPVLVLFHTYWSHPCQIQDPVLTEVANLCTERVKIARINADDNPDLSLWYGIRSIPTLLFFVHGNVLAEMIGTASKEAILEKLNTIVPIPPQTDSQT
jgi:thioredoxin 1